MNTLQAVYQLVVDHYKKIADVDCDSLYTVGALSYFFVRDRRMFDNFWVYIYHCLKKSTEDEAIKAAIFCISDFANNNGELISDKIDLMFTEFFKCF